MKQFSSRRSAGAEINITSLIDVIFMLVIFFMIGASFEKPAIALTLPKASSGKLTEKIPLLVSLDAEGRIFFDGNEVDVETLAAQLAAYGPELQNATVAMECDGKAVFDQVITVMDCIKNAGVRNVAVRHDPK